MNDSHLDNKQTILVTGTTGFTGGHLAKKLHETGHTVRALVRPGAHVQPLIDLGVELVEGDLACSEDVDRAVAGCQRVYHIGAIFRSAGHSSDDYHDVNVAGVGHVLTAARKHGVERTVHCSTVGVHGHVQLIPSDETAPYNPGDIYQETKLQGEQLAQKAIARGQPVSIVRPAGIYGPGDMRFLKLFKTIHNRTFRMFGRGLVPYHFTYIADLVDGIILCGEHPDALGEIFIIAGNEYVTLNQLVEMIAKSVNVKPPRGHLPLAPLMAAAKLCELVCAPLGIDPPLHTRRCEFFTKARAFTNAKSRKMLGYQPQVGLEEGMTLTAQWYKQQGLLGGRKR